MLPSGQVRRVGAIASSKLCAGQGRGLLFYVAVVQCCLRSAAYSGCASIGLRGVASIALCAARLASMLWRSLTVIQASVVPRTH
jgi:hypothetical protein